MYKKITLSIRIYWIYTRRWDLNSLKYFRTNCSSSNPALCSNRYIVLSMPKVVGNVFWRNTVKPRANIPTRSPVMYNRLSCTVSLVPSAPFNGVHLTIRKSSGEYVRVPRELIDVLKQRGKYRVGIKVDDIYEERVGNASRF